MLSSLSPYARTKEDNDNISVISSNFRARNPMKGDEPLKSSRKLRFSNRNLSSRKNMTQSISNLARFQNYYTRDQCLSQRQIQDHGSPQLVQMNITKQTPRQSAAEFRKVSDLLSGLNRSRNSSPGNGLNEFVVKPSSRMKSANVTKKKPILLSNEFKQNHSGISSATSNEPK